LATSYGQLQGKEAPEQSPPNTSPAPEGDNAFPLNESDEVIADFAPNNAIESSNKDEDNSALDRAEEQSGLGFNNQDDEKQGAKNTAPPLSEGNEPNGAEPQANAEGANSPPDEADALASPQPSASPEPPPEVEPSSTPTTTAGAALESPVSPPAAASPIPSSKALAPSAEPLAPKGRPLPDQISKEETINDSQPDIGPRVKGLGDANDFAGAPPIPDTRRSMAEGEAQEEYLVESGDTLYDICDQLIDEPDYWPKLWSLNPEIKNPHFIFPGMKLHFYAGDAATPPFLQVVAEDDVAPVEKNTPLTEKELVTEDISRLLLNPGTEDQVEMIEPKDLGETANLEDVFEFTGKVADPNQLDLTLPAFVFPEDREALGTIVGGATGSLLMDRPEEVIIENEGTLSPGSTHTVLRESEVIYEEKSGTYIGQRYEFVAHVKIEKKVDSDHVIGRITQNRLGLEPGDIVVPYIATSRRISLGSGQSGTAGAGHSVIGFDYPTMQAGGLGLFVFLTNNSGGRLAAGQNVAIYQNINRNASIFVADKLPDINRPIATARIIESGPTVAVGYVIRSNREVRLGDEINGPG
jgi:hypothetical protein